MKALMVFESMDFIRNQDPKKTLGIGLNNYNFYVLLVMDPDDTFPNVVEHNGVEYSEEDIYKVPKDINVYHEFREDSYFFDEFDTIGQAYLSIEDDGEGGYLYRWNGLYIEEVNLDKGYSDLLSKEDIELIYLEE